MGYRIRYVLAVFLVLSGLWPFSGYGLEFRQDLERDYVIRSIGQLQVTNMRGDIVIQGWALDKIRVKAKRKVIADTEEQARELLSAVDFRYRTMGQDIELSAEYGQGLDIQDRLKERENPKTGMEMVVFAPANLKLRVWAVDGTVTVKSWSAPVEVRTASGPIHIDSVKSESVSLLCPTCPMNVKTTRASVRCMGGTGNIELNDVRGSQVYVESSAGNQRMTGVQGEQLYVSKGGTIFGKDLRGRIEFHTQQAPVELVDAAGFLSGRTESGDITAKMVRWTFSDKALIESIRGSIKLFLPNSFSGDVDLWSMGGKTEVGFLVQKHQDQQVVGPEPVSRILGRIGEGGEVLKVFSEKGDILVARGGR